MTLSHLKRLFEHMSWADRAAAAALDAAPGAPAQALAAYAHVLGAELVWIDRLEGLPQSVPVWPGADLAACCDLAERSQQRYSAHIARLTEPDLDRPVPYVNSAGQSFQTLAGGVPAATRQDAPPRGEDQGD